MFIHDFARTYPAVAVEKKNVKTLIILCFDARFDLAMNGFITQELCLDHGTYKVIRLPGGPTPFAYHQAMQRECDELANQVLIACEVFPIEKIVLIMHGCCAYYQFVPLVPQEQESVLHVEREDLLLMPEYVKSLLPDKMVELYYAHLVNYDQQIAFQRIFATEAEFEAFAAQYALEVA